MSGVSNSVITILYSLQTLYTCLSLTIGQYIYAYYLEIYPNGSNGTVTSVLHAFESLPNETNQCVGRENSSDGDARLWTQERSANLFFWINLLSAGPLILTTYLLGLYRSKLGLRFVALLPMAGATIQIMIWLAIIYFHLPDIWWYVAAVVIGFSGSSGVLSLTLNLILTENTTESERSSRFVRLNAMQTALAAMTTFATGYYIAWRGFKDLYWMALVSQLLSMLIVIFYFKKSAAGSNLDEDRPLILTTDEESDELLPSNCSRFWEVCTVFRWGRRSKKKTISLYLTVVANTFFMLATTCFAPFLWLLLSAPFCWTSKEVGNYSALGAISSAILSLLGMQILTYVGATDAVICAISHVFFGLACLWTAFARHTWELYFALLINAPSGYQGWLTTSMMSKWLEVHERNHALTFITLINTMITTFGNSFFNWVYSRTVSNHRNMTLFISTGLAVVPFVLNICLFLITRKMSDEEAVPVSETDVEPTSLRLPSNTLPRAGLTDCMIIPSRTLVSTIHVATGDSAPHDSASDDELEEAVNPLLIDLASL